MHLPRGGLPVGPWRRRAQQRSSHAAQAGLLSVEERGDLVRRRYGRGDLVRRRYGRARHSLAFTLAFTTAFTDASGHDAKVARIEPGTIAALDGGPLGARDGEHCLIARATPNDEPLAEGDFVRKAESLRSPHGGLIVRIARPFDTTVAERECLADLQDHRLGARGGACNPRREHDLRNLRGASLWSDAHQRAKTRRGATREVDIPEDGGTQIG